jgi:hypothetical protein
VGGRGERNDKIAHARPRVPTRNLGWDV